MNKIPGYKTRVLPFHHPHYPTPCALTWNTTLPEPMVKCPTSLLPMSPAGQAHCMSASIHSHVLALRLGQGVHYWGLCIPYSIACTVQSRSLRGVCVCVSCVLMNREINKLKKGCVLYSAHLLSPPRPPIRLSRSSRPWT